MTSCRNSAVLQEQILVSEKKQTSICDFIICTWYIETLMLISCVQGINSNHKLGAAALSLVELH